MSGENFGSRGCVGKVVCGFAGAHSVYLSAMRYLVKARVRHRQEKALLRAVADGSLGRGSIAGDEYIYDMEQARLREDGTAEWIEVCYCAKPLQEERPYWEEFFELIRVKDAHSREIAATKTEPKPGLAAIATARNGWKSVCRNPENHFSKRWPSIVRCCSRESCASYYVLYIN